MASAGKKGKKPKGKSMSLQSFLAKNSEGLQEGYSIVTPRRDWAAEVENECEDEDVMDPVYSSRDQYILPSAPMGANVDLSKVPTKPPFTAFLGNLPYEIEESDIRALFKDLQIVNIRLPRSEGETGRPRGFGYIEFADQQSMIDALGKTDSYLRTGRIKIDVASNQDGQNRRRDNRGGPDKPDRSAELAGDWRTNPREDLPTGSDDRGFDRYGDRNSSNREGRFSNRGAFDQDQSRSGGGGFGGQRGFSDRPERNRSDDFSRSDFGTDRAKDDFSRPERNRSDDFSRSDFGSDRTRDDFNRSRGGSGRDDFNRSDRQGGRDDFNRSDRQGGRDDFSNFERSNRSSGFSGGRREFGTGFGQSGGRDDRQGDYGGRSKNYDRDTYDRGGGSGGYNENESGEREQQDPEQEQQQQQQPERDSEAADPPRTQVRPALVLQKRTKPLNESAAAPPAPSAIFGGARPVDTAAREREIEEKLAKEHELARDRDIRRDIGKERSGGGGPYPPSDDKPARRVSGPRQGDGVRSPRTSTSTQPSESGGSHHEEEDQEAAVTSQPPAAAAAAALVTEREAITSETKAAQRSTTTVHPPLPAKRPEATPAPLPTENAWSKRSGAAVVVAPPSASLEKQRNSESERDAERAKVQSNQQSASRRDEDTNGLSRDDSRFSGGTSSDRGASTAAASRGGGGGGRKVSGGSVGRGSHVQSGGGEARRTRDSDSRASHRKEMPKFEGPTTPVYTSTNKFSELQSDSLDD